MHGLSTRKHPVGTHAGLIARDAASPEGLHDRQFVAEYACPGDVEFRGKMERVGKNMKKSREIWDGLASWG
jgi:hypothetical protein